MVFVGIRVLLVDDHKMLREGIKQLLEFDTDIKVTAQASSGEECKNVFSNEFDKFDVCVLDLNLPDISGIELLRYISSNYKDSKVLVLTVHNEIDYLIDSINNGAKGYILKDSSSNELIKAIKSVYEGVKYIQPELIPLLNARLLRRDDVALKIKDLTKREKQILISVAQGNSNKVIADQFNITERTVKNHLCNLFKKIDVTDRTQAAVFAIKNNLVTL